MQTVQKKEKPPIDDNFVGEMWIWGRNTSGQLGLGLSVAVQSEHRPTHLNITRVIGSVRVRSFSCGRDHTACVTEKGELYAWGNGAYGKLGHGDVKDLNSPKKVEMLSLVPMKSVGCANDHSIGLTNAGGVYCWGYGAMGRLGQGDDLLNHYTSVPKMVGRLAEKKILSAGCGGGNNYAVATDNQVYVWGTNGFGELGVGSTDFVCRPQPIKVLGGLGVRSISFADSHAGCVTAQGALYIWGRNDDGRLAISGKKNVTSPTLHDISKKYTDIQYVSCGGRSTAIITGDRKIVSWQSSDAEGNSLKNDDIVPVLMTTIPDCVSHVAVGGTCGGHTTCVLENGDVWAWGKNNFGQTGRPPVAHKKNTDRMIPKKIPYVEKASKVFCGGYHSITSLCDNDALMLQYTREGNIAKMKALMDKQEQLVRARSSDGRTPLHIACSTANPQALRLLMGTLFAKVDEEILHSGFTPLHICCGNMHFNDEPKSSNDYLECLKILLKNVTNVNVQDKNGNTPLHLAIQRGDNNAAQLLIYYEARLDIKNNEQKTPLNYCDFTQVFEYKTLANINDICIIYSTSSSELATKMYKGFEQNYIRCTMNNPEVDARSSEEVLKNCIGIVFIVSEKSVISPKCVEKLVFAAKANLCVFSVWHEKLKLPPDVESIVFRRQLVDFSIPDKFMESLSQISSGLKKLCENAVEGNIQQTDELDNDVNPVADDDKEDDKACVYVSYDVSDKKLAEELRVMLSDAKVVCFMSRKNDNTDKEVVSKQIVSCYAFVAIISPKALKERAVREEISLAENYRRAIIPVFVNIKEQLDPSMEYTLANIPRFTTEEAVLQQMLAAVKLHQTVALYEAKIN